MEDINTGERFSDSFFKPWYSSLETNFRKSHQHLTNWTTQGKRAINIETAGIHFLENQSHSTSNSDMRAGHIKENNASKYVTRRGPKISRPKILIVHNYLKICKTICGASFITSFYFHSIPKQIWGDKHFKTGQITSRLYGRNCKLFLTPLSRNSQKRLEHKENQTKNWDMTRIPRNQVRIIIWRTWAIPKEI